MTTEKFFQKLREILRMENDEDDKLREEVKKLKEEIESER